MNKKGVELPINFIIIAAIGLGLLIVFFISFTSEAGEFSKTSQSCELKGGKCVAKGECEYQKTSWRCPKEKPQECCYNALG